MFSKPLIHSLRDNTLGRLPNWPLDLAHVRLAGESEDVVRQDTRVISDLWWMKDGINHYLSIKTVKPNIDQTAEAKRDLLKLQLQDPNSRVYYGLYYNPYGENRVDYSWTPPMGIFNFREDPVILIGKEYWDTLGGVGTYEIVLEIAQNVGEETREILATLNQ